MMRCMGGVRKSIHQISPKLRGYRYETIEEMKEAVMNVIDTLTQEDFHCWNSTSALQ